VRPVRRGVASRLNQQTIIHGSKPGPQANKASRGGGEHKGMDCPGAPTRRGRPHLRLDWLAAKYRAHNVVRGTQPCLRTCGLATPARLGLLVTRGATRSGAVTHESPAKQFTARRPAHTQGPSHGDGRHKGMSGPGAPLYRWAAVLRREGQHTCKINMATRLIVAGASQERDQGGGKRRTAAKLTLGRQCKSGRLGEDGRRGEVVHDSGAPSAPAS
jgi:hypothetical protein